MSPIHEYAQMNSAERQRRPPTFIPELGMAVYKYWGHHQDHVPLGTKAKFHRSWGEKKTEKPTGKKKGHFRGFETKTNKQGSR